MKSYFLFYFIVFSASIFAQDRMERITPKQQKYTDILEDLGSPLKGNPVLIINYFAEKEGSYLFFLNETKAQSTSSLTGNPKDLYAGVYIEDHGGILPQINFKDFAGPLSQPRYLLNQCIVDDADKNKSPEFYLTYFEESDGLDAKPLKVIVYSKNGKSFIKSKITAWISYQPEDKEKTEKDENFKKLPQNIQDRAQNLLKEGKKVI